MNFGSLDEFDDRLATLADAFDEPFDVRKVDQCRHRLYETEPDGEPHKQPRIDSGQRVICHNA